MKVAKRVLSNFLVILLAFIACIVLTAGSKEKREEPQIPPKDPPASSQEAEELYERFQLQKKGNVILQGDSVELHKSWQLKPLFNESSETAIRLYRKSSRQTKVGLVFGGVGGALIGAPIGYRMGSNTAIRKTDGIVMGSGAGLATIGIILTITGNRSLKNAVESYNQHLKQIWNLESSNPHIALYCFRFW